MRVVSEFNDERTRKVNHKAARSMFYKLVHFVAGETETTRIWTQSTDPPDRAILLSNGFTLDNDVISTMVLLKTEADAIVNTVFVHPGQDVVLPLDNAIQKIVITSNSNSDGLFKIMVTESV